MDLLVECNLSTIRELEPLEQEIEERFARRAREFAREAGMPLEAARQAVRSDPAVRMPLIDFVVARMRTDLHGSSTIVPPS